MYVLRLSSISLATLWSVAACYCQVDLARLEKADLVIVGKVSADAAQQRHQKIKSNGGEDRAELAFAVYSVSEPVVIKGICPNEIRVLAASDSDFSGWGASGQERARRLSLPTGKRVLLYLQKERGSRFRFSYLGGTQAGYIDALVGVGYALDDFVSPAPRFIVPEDRVAKLGIKRDFPARDLARAVLAASEIDDQGCIVPDPNYHRLLLTPPAFAVESKMGKREYEQYTRWAMALGPDPPRFFFEQIEDNLPRLTNQATIESSLDRLALAGSWGSNSAAASIADLILASDGTVDTSIGDACGSAAGAVRNMAGGLNSCTRLLGSRRPEVVRQAVMGLAGNKKYRSDVRRLLSREDPDVLRWAMYSLAATDSDFDHYPRIGWDDGFEAGSHNARLLDYWRSKE